MFQGLLLPSKQILVNDCDNVDGILLEKSTSKKEEEIYD